MRSVTHRARAQRALLIGYEHKATLGAGEIHRALRDALKVALDIVLLGEAFGDLLQANPACITPRV